MISGHQGWGGFGAYSLSGELPREEPLRLLEQRMTQLQESSTSSEIGAADELADLRREWTDLAGRLYADLEPWEAVVLARHPHRPIITDYIARLVDDFCELHGDGVFGDDPAMVTGFGTIDGQRVMLVGHNRGRETADRVACRFGCSRPEGYRKALAKMTLAAKFDVPIVTLIDTPGAYPGTESEERGIARAIAENLAAMPRLNVPIVSIVTGEGGSGGALGIGVGDRLAMLEHSVYSVISPEGCAAILFKTGSMAREAAGLLRLQAKDLLGLGLIDEILPEPQGGAHRHHEAAASTLKEFVLRSLKELRALGNDRRRELRYRRWREAGSSLIQEQLTL